MKHITLFSLVAASLLFTACGEKTKEAASEATNAVTEAVKEDTVSAVESAKKAAAEAAEATKKAAAEAAKAAKEEADKLAAAAAAKAAEIKAAAETKAAEATEAVKETAAAATEAVTEAVSSDNELGKNAYAKCISCHGDNGQTRALGKAEPVAGQSAQALEEALLGYKAGTRNVAGMGMLMKGQVSSMDEATIKAVAEYMSGL
jgi:cytochrome c